MVPCSSVLSFPEPCPVLIKDQRWSPRSSSCCQGQGEVVFFFPVAVNSRPTCLTVQIGGKTFSTLVSIFFWIYSLKAKGIYCWTPLSPVINIFRVNVIFIFGLHLFWFCFSKLHRKSVIFHLYLSYFSAFCPYIWKSTTCHFKNGTLYRQMAHPCPPLLPPLLLLPASVNCVNV